MQNGDKTTGPGDENQETKNAGGTTSDETNGADAQAKDNAPGDEKEEVPAGEEAKGE